MSLLYLCPFSAGSTKIQRKYSNYQRRKFNLEGLFMRFLSISRGPALSLSGDHWPLTRSPRVDAASALLFYLSCHQFFPEVLITDVFHISPRRLRSILYRQPLGDLIFSLTRKSFVKLVKISKGRCLNRMLFLPLSLFEISWNIYQCQISTFPQEMDVNPHKNAAFLHRNYYKISLLFETICGNFRIFSKNRAMQWILFAFHWILWNP